MIGQTLGHFQILEKIGAGGMGVVYRAHDERLDRDVALKVLPEGTLADETARKRFRKEALALAKLSHPNIGAIYDFDTQTGVDFLAMEYIPGVTLSDRLASGPLSQKEIAHLGTQLADGLGAAHQQGVVHRDLKPGNLRITPDGRVKILDFGLAKLLRPTGGDDLTRSISETQATAGTLPYMAPEQLRGEPADPRTDIYALGVVLYELATGRRPFEQRLATALAGDIQHKPPPPPGRLNPDLAPRLEEIILKCLEKEQENRYQSAKELEVDLRRLGTPRTTAAGTSRAARAARIRAAWTAGLAAALFAAVLAGLDVGGLRQRLLGHTPPPQIGSLAVLPLENLSHEPEQDYFAEGMTEELITNLAKIRGLRVISRTSVMQYRGTMKPVREIGRELNVDAVVEGSVLRSGDRVRITAQLIRAATDTHVWAESYERELRDVLALQNEVARAIANRIGVELTPQERVRLASARPLNFEAYQLYLRGRYFWNKRDPASIKKAVGYFQQAVDKDPDYALGYAGLADAYSFLPDVPRQEQGAKGKALYAKALELDNNLAEAHAGLGLLAAYALEWENSEREFKRAIELNPNYASAHQWYASLLDAEGRMEEAKAEIQRAVESDPLSSIINTRMAYHLALEGHLDEAIAQFHRVLEINPNFGTALSFLAATYEEKGMFAEAIAEEQTEKMLYGDPNERDKVALEAKALSDAYAKAGPRGYWRKRLELAMSKFKPHRALMPTEVSRVEIAEYYARLGQKQQALEWLAQSCAEREPELEWRGLKTIPAFRALRSDPRFGELMRCAGLPP